MAENNNNNGKKRNDIFTKINDTISTFLDGYPPAVQTAAKVIVFGGMFLLVIGIFHLISPIIITVVGNHEPHLYLRHFGAYRHLYRVPRKTRNDPR